MDGVNIHKLSLEIQQVLIANGVQGDTLKIASEISWIADRRFYEDVRGVNKALTYDQFKDIFRKYNSEGGCTLAELANHYGTSIGTVQRIVKNEYW